MVEILELLNALAILIFPILKVIFVVLWIQVGWWVLKGKKRVGKIIVTTEIDSEKEAK